MSTFQQSDRSAAHRSGVKDRFRGWLRGLSNAAVETTPSAGVRPGEFNEGATADEVAQLMDAGVRAHAGR